jgi:hypothetical protein
MNKKLTAFILLLLISSASIAQIETFDLSQFKLPYLKYQNFNVSFNAYNQSQFNNWKDTSDFKYNNSIISTYLTANGYYNLYLNTPTQQSNYNIQTSIYSSPYDDYKRVFNDQSSIQYFYSNMAFNLIARSRNRFYSNNKIFIEVAPSVEIYYNRSFSKSIYRDNAGNSTYDYRSTVNNPQLRTSFEIGAGYGRIEQVTYAQMALFVLKDLKNENRLQREPTHEEIYKLAELISQKQNQRFFDYRHRIIDQVKAIDSFLTSLGLSEQTDATYFTTIYDNWLYANNPSRLSGFRISGGPKIVYNFNQYNSNWEQIEPIEDDGVNKFKGSILAYGVWLSALDEKPLNHYWQRSLSASLDYTFTNESNAFNENPKEMRLNDNLLVNLKASVGYYPTTRTYINFGLESGFQMNNMDKYSYPPNSNYDDEQFKYISIYAGPILNGYYYFSPKVQLRFNSTFSYSFYNTDNFNLFTPPPVFGFNYIKANRINAYITASLIYSIF